VSFEQQRTDLFERGFCYLDAVIPPDEVAAVRDSVERDVWKHNTLERPTGYVPGFLRFNQAVARYASSRRMLDFVESLFGPHVRISMFTGIVNGRGIQRGALHSDWPFNQKSAAHIPAPYPETLIHIVTMWMLTPFTEENGGTIVVPGSHKRPCHPMSEESMKPADGEIQLTGKPGTVAVFDARLWHAVATNRSNADRVAVLVRYAPWWLNLDTLRPGTIDHRDIVEANGGKDSVVPALDPATYERLPEAMKPLVKFSVKW
jgi:hypothetical protein